MKHRKLSPANLLVAAAPSMAGPFRCSNCGAQTSPLIDGLCGLCFDVLKRNR